MNKFALIALVAAVGVTSACTYDRPPPPPPPPRAAKPRPSKRPLPPQS